MFIECFKGLGGIVKGEIATPFKAASIWLAPASPSVRMAVGTLPCMKSSHIWARPETGIC